MMPPAYTEMAHSADLLESLKGYVLQVGVCEELCKIAPAIFYVLWKKRRGEPVPPRAVVVIAVFSAIGFSAAENVDYARKAVSHATLCAKKTNPEIVIAGIKGAMVNYLFRSLVLVFLHAVFSGIFGCFLAIGAHTRRLWPVLFLLGLAASAGLHGLYDWTVDRSMLAAATVVWLSFVLFYALSARPRIVLGEHALQMETGEEMKNGAVGRPAVLE
jgi:RsiW-degrading membrane proteinase PrsW (M82 family)